MTFGIQCDVAMIRLYSNKANIPKLQFVDIFKTFEKSASFEIELVTEENKDCPIVTTKELHDHLIAANLGDLVQTQENGCMLKKTDTNKVMRSVTEFATVRYGVKPNKKQKLAVAKAIVNLFPTLKSKDPNGSDTVILFTKFHF